MDVVVIGAGVSGLYAAGQLQRDGREVIVLEARDRVGGRLLSVPMGSTRLDLGATWFWDSEPLINQLVADAKLDAFRQHLDGDMVFQQSPDTAQRVEGNQLDVPSSRLTNGMQTIAEHLLSQCSPDTAKLSHPVRSIRSDAERLEVKSDDGTWEAAHVIVAVPPSLAVASIDFGGELDANIVALAAATPVWMGSTVKVVAHYGDAFWRRDGLAGAAFSYAGPMREIHDISGPNGEPAALFGFCAVEPGGPAPTEAEITSQLMTLFGQAAASPLHVEIADWRTERFTSPPNVEALTNYQTYGHRLYQTPAMHGRLHWASTETATTAPGHIEGALQAATRAVTAIQGHQSVDRAE